MSNQASRLTAVDRYCFRGNGLPVATGSASESPWRYKFTNTPTISNSADGLVMALAATNEAENNCLYFDDILSYDIDDLVRIEFLLKVTIPGTITASQVAFGLAGTRNDAIDSIAQHASFRLIGTSDLLLESDDGTNDNDDKDTGIDIVSGDWYRFAIDFSEGNQTRSAPYASLGGKGDVHFYAGSTAHRRQSKNVGFDMSNYSGGLQPYVQLQKTASTNVISVTLREITVETKMN